MAKQELIERLADAEHASWARWMDYLFSTCIPGPHGTLILQPENVEHWRRQIETPYADLSEREKQSDRDEVAHIMPFIEAALAESTARADRLAVEVEELRAAGDAMAEAIDGLVKMSCVVEWPSGAEARERWRRALGVVGEGQTT